MQRARGKGNRNGDGSLELGDMDFRSGSVNNFSDLDESTHTNNLHLKKGSTANFLMNLNEEPLQLVNLKMLDL